MGIYNGIKEEMISLIENLNLEDLSTEEWEETKYALEKCFSVAQYTNKVFKTEDAGLQPKAVSQKDTLPDEEIPIHSGNEEGSMIDEPVFQSTVSSDCHLQRMARFGIP